MEDVQARGSGYKRWLSSLSSERREYKNGTIVRDISTSWGRTLGVSKREGQISRGFLGLITPEEHPDRQMKIIQSYTFYNTKSTTAPQIPQHRLRLGSCASSSCWQEIAYLTPPRRQEVYSLQNANRRPYPYLLMKTITAL